ncbi:MAG: hypothetical protein ACYSW8_21525 [Planctomycetota bacterium]|jgi:hypothetical protein
MREQPILHKFKRVLRDGYRQAKAAGLIPSADLQMCEQTMAQAYALTGQEGNRHWRRIHRRVMGRYRRDTGATMGVIDWEAVMAWIMENIVPLVRLLLTLLPIFLAHGPRR